MYRSSWVDTNEMNIEGGENNKLKNGIEIRQQEKVDTG